MTFASSTRSAFRFSPILWSGLAVLMLHSAHTFAAGCTQSAQCETGGACCVNCFPDYGCVNQGVQQGVGSCLGEEACCMPDGTCQAGGDEIRPVTFFRSGIFIKANGRIQL